VTRLAVILMVAALAGCGASGAPHRPGGAASLPACTIGGLSGQPAEGC
jgi:hypothetical protein